MITKPYRLLRIRDVEVLLCLVCDRWSANPNDLLHRYCGYCHLWLETLPPSYQRTDEHLQPSQAQKPS